MQLLDPWEGMPNLSDSAPSKNIQNAKKKPPPQIIEYSRALSLFNTIIILKVFDFAIFLMFFLIFTKKNQDFPNEWSGVKIECPLTPSYGIPGPMNTGWTNSPQYQFELVSNNEIQVFFFIF